MFTPGQPNKSMKTWKYFGPLAQVFPGIHWTYWASPGALAVAPAHALAQANRRVRTQTPSFSRATIRVRDPQVQISIPHARTPAKAGNARAHAHSLTNVETSSGRGALDGPSGPRWRLAAHNLHLVSPGFATDGERRPRGCDSGATEWSPPLIHLS